MQKEWPVGRLSGQIPCGVLGQQLRDREGEEEQPMQSSLFPFYLHCLLQETRHRWQTESILSVPMAYRGQTLGPFLCFLVSGRHTRPG